MTESTDLTHSSREAWKTIKRLLVDQTKESYPHTVTAKQISTQLLLNGKGNTTNAKQPKPRLMKHKQPWPDQLILRTRTGDRN